jgi:hypothetical protein
MDPLHLCGEPELYRRGGFCGVVTTVAMRFSFDENFNCSLFALAAVGGHTKLLLQLPKIGHAVIRRLADLTISYCVADADVHDFNELDV